MLLFDPQIEWVKAAQAWAALFDIWSSQVLQGRSQIQHCDLFCLMAVNHHSHYCGGDVDPHVCENGS